MKTLEELVRELPPDLQEEVRRFAEFLLNTRARPKRNRLRLSWAGGLREFRNQFSSLELEKKALEWWSS